MLVIRARLMRGEAIAMGPGKADLLQAIAAHGSIAAAARAMAMSYARAWRLVAVMNAAFAQPLVETAHGGARHGGARLTPTGAAALARYRALETALKAAGAAEGAALEAMLAR